MVTFGSSVTMATACRLLAGALAGGGVATGRVVAAGGVVATGGDAAPPPLTGQGQIPVVGAEVDEAVDGLAVGGDETDAVRAGNGALRVVDAEERGAGILAGDRQIDAVSLRLHDGNPGKGGARREKARLGMSGRGPCQQRYRGPQNAQHRHHPPTETATVLPATE